MNNFAALAIQQDTALEERIRQQRDASAIRYIFCPFTDMRTDAILNGIVPLGTITPISVQRQPVGDIYLQPILEHDPEREKEFHAFDDKGARIKGVGHVEIKPSAIVDELLTRYAQQGAIQLRNLFALPISDYVQLNLQGFFVGEYFDEQEQRIKPYQHRSADSYLDQFQRVEEQLTLQPNEKQKKLLAVLQELRESVRRTKAWATIEAETANVKLGTKDLPTFSPYHHRLFEFSGVTPRDAAVNAMAKDQIALTQQLPELLSTIAENNRGTSGEDIAQGIVQGLAPFLDKLTSTVAKVVSAGSGKAKPSAPVEEKPNA